MYEIRIRAGRKTLRTIRGYADKHSAVVEAQTLADSLEFPRGARLSVHKTPKTKRKDGRYKGHTVQRTGSGFVVQPYGHRFAKMGEAKKWIDGHVSRESRRKNPGTAPKPKSAAKPARRRNPSKRAPIRKRIDLSADRIDWSAASKTEMRAIADEADKRGAKSLAAKARSALKRRK